MDCDEEEGGAAPPDLTLLDRGEDEGMGEGEGGTGKGMPDGRDDVFLTRGEQEENEEMGREELAKQEREWQERRNAQRLEEEHRRNSLEAACRAGTSGGERGAQVAKKKVDHRYFAVRSLRQERGEAGT